MQALLGISTKQVVYVKKKRIEVIGEAAMNDYGKKLAQVTSGSEIIYLTGPLGAGKTTISRGIIRGFGYKGAVKSPTFTLIEPYYLDAKKSIYHFDLYRLADPEELELIGARDYFKEGLCLIEWPERGKNWLPTPDVVINIEYAADRRYITLTPHSEHGIYMLHQLRDCS